MYLPKASSPEESLLCLHLLEQLEIELSQLFIDCFAGMLSACT
jgi:hypothetical protein